MTRRRKPRLLIHAGLMTGFMALTYAAAHAAEPTPWFIALLGYFVFAAVIANVDVGGM